MWKSVPSPDPLRPGATESDYLRVHARYLIEVSPLRTCLAFLQLVVTSVLTALSGMVLVGSIAGLAWSALAGHVAGKVALVAALVRGVAVASGVAQGLSRRRVLEAGPAKDLEIVCRDVVVLVYGVRAAGALAALYVENAERIADWFGASRAHLGSSLLAAGVGGSSVLGGLLLTLVRGQLAPKRDTESRRSRWADLGRRALIALVELALLFLVPLTALTAFVIGWVRPEVGVPSEGNPTSITPLAAGVLVLVGLLAIVAGDRALSPHAFYRDRLARAFSMVRQEDPKQPDGVNPAEQGTSTEWPVLARARPLQPRLSSMEIDLRYPKLLICASVNITEEGVAAAGVLRAADRLQPTRHLHRRRSGGGVADERLRGVDRPAAQPPSPCTASTAP